MKRVALLICAGMAATLTASTAMGAIVAVCHVPPGNPSQAKTILVGAKAADAHLKNHAGDFLGFCACQVDDDCDEGARCESGECINLCPCVEYWTNGIGAPDISSIDHSLSLLSVGEFSVACFSPGGLLGTNWFLSRVLGVDQCWEEVDPYVDNDIHYIPTTTAEERAACVSYLQDLGCDFP